MRNPVRILAAVLAAAAALFAGAASCAEAWPTKPVKLVVGFPPGGGNDLIARIISAKLSERLGQPVIVENKAGANAIIATEYVAKSAPDGYTLYVGASGAIVFNPGLYDKLPYDPVKDFAPVTQIALFPVIFAVNPSVPARSIKDLIALAKSKPGQIFYAAGSTPFQVITEQFRKQAGINVTHVPYKGSAAAINAAVAGEVSFVTVDAPGAALAQVKAGKLRGLALTSRSAVAPDIPGMAESGMPNFQVALWTGLFAPAATPKPVLDKLYAEMAAVLKSDEVKTKFAGLGYEPGGVAPAEFASIIKADLEKWTRVAREGNIKAE